MSNNNKEEFDTETIELKSTERKELNKIKLHQIQKIEIENSLIKPESKFFEEINPINLKEAKNNISEEEKNNITEKEKEKKKEEKNEEKLKENGEEKLTEKEKEKGEKKKIFVGQGKPVSIFDLYFKYATKSDMFFVFLALLGSIGSGVSMPIFSLLFGSTISSLGPRNSQEDLSGNITNMIIQFSVIGIAMFIANFMNSACWIYTSMRNLLAFKREYFKVIMKQEQGWFDKNNPYTFSTMVQAQIKSIETGLGEKLGNILMSFSTFITGIIIAFTTSWKLTLVLIGMMPLMTIGIMIMSKAVQKGAKAATEAYTKAGGVAEECLYQIKTVASFTNFKYEMDKYDNYIKLSRDIAIKNAMHAALGMSISFTVLYSTYCLAVWFGSKLILDGELNQNTGKLFSGGDVITVILTSIMSAIALGRSAPFFKAIAEARIAASDFYELAERKNEIDMSKSTKKPEKENIKGNIELKNVRFSYPIDTEKEVLKGINFVFPAGKKIAIVGESGSGKSTIVNLLERLYDINSGEILIDGINIKEYDLPYLRSCIGYVQQEPVLFNNSIKENIIFGRENATDEMIREALKESLADEFVNNIKENIDFKVGIKGKNLSGGQKQRIAIARAILNKPKILILDEATSALDNNNEKLVQLSLDRVSKNVTTVVIAHRLSTIINADIIIAMKSGEILETGKHEDLLNQKGYYFNLFKSQAKDEEEKKLNESLKKSFKKEKDFDKEIDNILQESNGGKDFPEKKLDENLAKKESEKLIKESKMQLFNYLKDSKCTMILAGFSAALSGAVFPCYGIVLAFSVDVLSSNDKSIVEKEGFFMAMMFLVVAFGAGLGVFLQNYYFSKIGENLCQNLRSAVFKKYLQMHIGFFDLQENAPGILMTKLSSETTKLNGIVLSMIGVSVQSFVNLVLGLSLGFYFDWRLSLISLGFMPLIAISGGAQHKLRKGLIQQDELLDLESGGILSESVINTKTIFSYNMHGKIVEYYQEIINHGKKGLVKQSIITGCALGFSQLITFVTFSVVFYAGGTFISDKSISFGDMIKAIFSIIFSAFGVGQAQQYMGDYSKARVAIESIFKTLNAESTINPFDEHEAQKKDAKNIKGKIEFKNVSFSYPTRNDTIVLKNISFVIHPGQNVAFTGFSGSGKSTIIQLIERFYDVQEGEIFIDDINIKEYNICSLRKKIGIVMQEPNIFKRNIRENIEYGKLGAAYEEIVLSAEKAMISEFFKNGKKGEKDDNVSGGQKQRVSIARAILKDPRILLLDEATSALDKNSETEVQKAIDNASEKRTTVTIAHRLSTIEKCDMIYVLDQGEIVEKGNHLELLKFNGFYAKQVNSAKK